MSNDICNSLEESENVRRDYYDTFDLDSNIKLDTSLYASGKTYNLIEKFTKLPFAFILGQSHAKLDDLNNRIHREQPSLVEGNDYHVVRSLENTCSEFLTNIDSLETFSELRNLGIDMMTIHRIIHPNGDNCPYINQDRRFEGRTVMTFDRLISAIHSKHFKGGGRGHLTLLLDEIDGFLDGEEIHIPTRELEYEIRLFMDGDEFLPSLSEVVVPEGEEERLRQQYRNLIRNEQGEIDINAIRENEYHITIIRSKLALIERHYVTKRYDNNKSGKTTFELIPKAFGFLKFLFEHRNIRLIAGSATLRTDKIKLEIFRRYYSLARDLTLYEVYKYVTDTENKDFILDYTPFKKGSISRMSSIMYDHSSGSTYRELVEIVMDTDHKKDIMIKQEYTRLVKQAIRKLLTEAVQEYRDKYTISTLKHAKYLQLFSDYSRYLISEFDASFISQEFYFYYYSMPDRGFSMNHYKTRISRIGRESYEEVKTKRLRLQREIEKDVCTVLDHTTINSKLPTDPKVLLITFSPVVRFIEEFIAKKRANKEGLGYFKNMDIRPWFSNTTHGINAHEKYHVVVLLGDPLPPHIVRYTSKKELIGNIKSNQRGFILKDGIPLDEEKFVYSSMFSEPMEGGHRGRRKIPSIWIGNFMDMLWHGTPEQHNIIREILERDWIRPVKLNPTKQFKIEIENNKKIDV